MRGTFANIRIRNQMLAGVEGGITRYAPDRRDACRSTTRRCTTRRTARRWSSSPARNMAPARRATGRPRAPILLGVRAVIAESFERIHRSNLVGMGVLPLQFRDGESADSLGLDGSETFTITGVADLEPRQEVDGQGDREATAASSSFTARCRIDTVNELEYFRTAASSTTCCGSWRRRDADVRARSRGRRLGRRGTDPARLSAPVDGQADRPVGWSISGMNVVGAAGFVVNGWWHGALPSAALNVIWMLIGAGAYGGSATQRGLVDLSHVIEEGMTTYKGLPAAAHLRFLDARRVGGEIRI